MATNYEAIQFTDYNNRLSELGSRLSGYTDDELTELARSANSYDGSFDYFDAFDIDDLGEYITDPVEAARATFFGDIDNWGDRVRFNAYGNLESAHDSDIADLVRDELGDLAMKFLDGDLSSVELHNEDEELVDGWGEYDSMYDDDSDLEEVQQFFNQYE